MSERPLESSDSSGRSRQRIYLSPPTPGPEEVAAVREMLDQGWMAPDGPPARAFEQALGDYLETDPSCLFVTSSGTAAMHLALRAAGVEPGDVVFAPTFTFVASVNPIGYLGAEPWLIGSEAKSWGMDPKLLERGIREAKEEGHRIGAVIAVHLFGQCCDMSGLRAVCERYEIPLIEDAAEALGGKCQLGKELRKAGTLGDFGVLSFNGNKLISTAGGGAVVCPDPESRNRVAKWAQQSKEDALWYEHEESGYNYAMNGLAAAVGRVQVKRIDERVAKKRLIYERYQHLFEERGLPVEMGLRDAFGGVDSCWLSTVLLPEDGLTSGRSREGKSLSRAVHESFRNRDRQGQGNFRNRDRDRVIRLLEGRNIEARPLWKPMQLQPLFGEVRVVLSDAGERVSESVFARGLCLPSGVGLMMEEQERVVDALRQF
jgi:pyridoxal phosphate-dependent aminotransferase EpsN